MTTRCIVFMNENGENRNEINTAPASDKPGVYTLVTYAEVG